MAQARRIDDFGGITLDDAAIADVANALAVAERDRTQIRLLSERHPGMTMDDAYAVQAAWVRMKRAAGDPVIGWKIGLTSKAMQAALSIDIPDSGVLLGSMVFANGADIPAGRFIQPRVEAEIAFVMKETIDPVRTSAEAILAATDFVAPALEILDTRITRRDPIVCRQNIWRRSGRKLAEGRPRLGVDVRRRACGAASADTRWSVA